MTSGSRFASPSGRQLPAALAQLEHHRQAWRSAVVVLCLPRRYRVIRRWLEACLFDRLLRAAVAMKALMYRGSATGATWRFRYHPERNTLDIDIGGATGRGRLSTSGYVQHYPLPLLRVFGADGIVLQHLDGNRPPVHSGADGRGGGWQEGADRGGQRRRGAAERLARWGGQTGTNHCGIRKYSAIQSLYAA